MWPSKEEEQHMQQTHQTPGPLTTAKAFRRPIAHELRNEFLEELIL